MAAWFRTACSGCGRDLMWLQRQRRHRCAWCGLPASCELGEGERLEVRMER